MNILHDNRVKAFTLIELLVTIVIISILAAILMPAAGVVRERSRRAQCANNLRQIGVALYIYLDEHSRSFPQYGGEDAKYVFGGKRGTKAWLPAKDRPINPYLEIYSDGDTSALQVFHCPSDVRQVEGCGGEGAPSYFDYYGTSYEMNQYLIDAGSMWAVKAPHTKVMMAKDIADADIAAHGGELPRQRVNVLFLDGHVKMYNYGADFSTSYSDTSKPVFLKVNIWQR